jgi:hypothetical protein
MESFTGAEIAALISVGCVIGSGRIFSEQLAAQILENPMIRIASSYSHWIRGVYLITG